MARTIHLIRHGHHPQLGQFLCGRMAGVSLDTSGRRQMAHCAELLDPRPDVIRSSPQLRTRQSASILGRMLGLPVQIASEIDEIDYGEWTGRRFADLQTDPAWSRWNAQRGSSRPPGGESMSALQRRVIAYLERLHRDPTATTIALISHAEPIRAALLHYKGLSLDEFLSIEVGPASIHTLWLDEAGVQVTCSNDEVAA
ncbi:histidine phosphatase family protein [Bradyrhizobium sp. WSM 1704]|uniref:histidine phosphatase family protein n=1 Tax=Bradyrhizobium semiaridum TaxID=2821404 RepID=UPI001CE2C7EC|nr:histidine phosphatase family protein [Bradyrhizobium semiaridum]MCA6125206.1 histidine phosphatase family protein [Bradyrhizobium semiaridum]